MRGALPSGYLPVWMQESALASSGIEEEHSPYVLCDPGHFGLVLVPSPDCLATSRQDERGLHALGSGLGHLWDALCLVAMGVAPAALHRLHEDRGSSSCHLPPAAVLWSLADFLSLLRSTPPGLSSSFLFANAVQVGCSCHLLTMAYGCQAGFFSGAPCH